MSSDEINTGGIPPKNHNEAWLECVEELAGEHPIPDDLRAMIEDQIEPVTMNMGVDHDDVMSAIEAAFPLVLNYYDRIDIDATKIRHFAAEE